MRTIYVGDTVYQKTETGFISFEVAEVIDQSTVVSRVNGQDNRISDFLTLSEVYRIHGEDAFVDGLENASELELLEVEHTITQDDLDANAPDLAESGIEVGDVVTFTADESREIDEANNPAEGAIDLKLISNLGLLTPSTDSKFMQENAPEVIENGTAPEITVPESALKESTTYLDAAPVEPVVVEEPVKEVEPEEELTKTVEPTPVATEETLPAKAPATKKASTRKKK